jgi:hypothetical protein
MPLDDNVDMRVKHKIGDMMVRQIVLEEERDEARRQLAEANGHLAVFREKMKAEKGGSDAV